MGFAFKPLSPVAKRRIFQRDSGKVLGGMPKSIVIKQDKDVVGGIKLVPFNERWVGEGDSVTPGDSLDPTRRFSLQMVQFTVINL